MRQGGEGEDMPVRRALRILGVCGVLALAGCGGATPTAVTPRATSPTPVATLAPRSPSPPRPTSGTVGATNCDSDAVEQRIRQFIDAFNRGDQTALARFFGPDFQWYSVTEGDPTVGGRHFLAYNPQGGLVVSGPPPGERVTVGHQEILLPYFAARHAHGERLQIRHLAIDVRSDRHPADFTYELTREADDLPPGLGGPERIVKGKGAIRCPDGTSVVWSMGMAQQ